MRHTHNTGSRGRAQLRAGRISGSLVVSLLLNAALAGGLAYFYFAKPAGGSANATKQTGLVASGDAIEALGKVQPTGGVVNVFGPPGDRLFELKANLGDKVAKDAVLAVLSGDTERRLSVATLGAQLTEADALRTAIEKSKEAKLADLKLEAEQAVEKAKAELAALDAKIDGFQAQLDAAKVEQNRLATVEQGGVRVSAQEKAQAELLVKQADLQLKATQGQRKSAQEQLDAAPQTTAVKRQTIDAETKRALAQVPFESLKAAKQAAEQKLKDAALVAPVAGRVVKLFSRTGDTLTTLPVLQIADTDNMAVIAEVYETDVARLRKWLASGPVTAEVHARVLGDGNAAALKGTVAGIAPMIAKNSVFALGPREDADRRVVEVEVRLEGESARAVADYVGLQVRTRFVPPK